MGIRGMVLFLGALASSCQSAGPRKDAIRAPSSSAPSAEETRPASLPLLPWPAQMNFSGPGLVVGTDFSVALEGYREPRLARAVDRFLGSLERESKIQFAREENAASQAQLVITTAGASQPVQAVGEDESYRLAITPAQIKLTAANPLGILHGLQTLRQLARAEPGKIHFPVGTLSDQPRFPWRGLLIDSGRHFISVPAIKRNLDGMEAVKLNVLHWHITDDQSFPIESKKFPRLQQEGSGGLYYTQDQVRDVIAYARDRGIRVVPEFDMPGHATSWFIAYPKLGSGPGPYKLQTIWGPSDVAMNPTLPSTYAFLDQFIGEMSELFPDAYFHIGGDECNGKEWDANPAIQKFMRAHGFKNDAELQAYFTENVQKLVVQHGKIPAGWDEILQPTTPKDVMIQSWRGASSLAEAARRGYGVILSSGYYLDLNYSAADHYAVDPLGGAASTLPPDEQRRVLGGEAAIWTEYVNERNLDSRIWPRAAAIAERLWSDASVRDVDSLYQRLDIVSRQLADLGLQHRSTYPAMLKTLAGGGDTTALRVLGNALQPVMGYRWGYGDYSVASPLNHLVDAIPPESGVARKFTSLVQRLLAGEGEQKDWNDVKRRLELWRANDARLQPMLLKSPLTAELVPVSTTLSKVAQTGLEAIAYLENHQAPPSSWYGQRLSLLQKAGKPVAALDDKVVAPVMLLVKAANARRAVHSATERR